MDSDGSDNFEDLYEEGDERKHNKLVEKVLKLNKSQHLKKPSRSEPTLKISEFDLVQSITGEKGSVQIDSLAKILTNRKSRVKIGEKVKKTSKNAHTLPKPLEKIQADKIRRAVSYEKARLELDRWEPTVTSNRVSTNLSFPLDNDFKIDQKESANFPSMWRTKTKLDEELEKNILKAEEFQVEVEQGKEQFPLTMKEMLARRKEAAKLRAFQGYKEAKARRQNKIKSKKYHRIQKREKIKQKLKEFELLQKTDPEEALKKLEEIEKARVEERFSLRHKSTGQWARSKQVRAKYDKESRQVLAQQLTISKELTQKLKSQQSDSEEELEEVEDANVTVDESNPWINGVKPGKEVAGFVSDYRKYWTEKHKQDLLKVADVEENAVMNNTNCNYDDVSQVDETNETKNTNEVSTEMGFPQKQKSNKKKRGKKSKSERLNKSTGTSEWDVSVVELEIESMFDKLENKLQKKMLKNVKNLQKQVKNNKSEVRKSLKIDNSYRPDLSLPLQTKRPIIDEELIETADEDNLQTETNDNLTALKNILKSETESEKNLENIDPNKYLKVKTTSLSTAIPDILTTDENEEDVDQRQIITEAFEDDDIIQEFDKDKKDEIDKNKPKDIDLGLPGWGSWGGAGVKMNKRKRGRFIIKAPEKIPRRDDNKGMLIINEKAQSKIKDHMVSELPFPFKTVKDFEASIRAPIGNTFVPYTAFKRIIKPVVKTKMGAIIEPISREMLVNNV